MGFEVVDSGFRTSTGTNADGTDFLVIGMGLISLRNFRRQYPREALDIPSSRQNDSTAPECDFARATRSAHIFAFCVLLLNSRAIMRVSLW